MEFSIHHVWIFIASETSSSFQQRVQRAVSFPVHPLPVTTKSHSSALVFLIESGNAAKCVNAFWADVQHIGSHLHLEELFFSLKHTGHHV